MKYLCYFLKQCNSLTTLSVANNSLADFHCGDIIACLEKPLPDFASGFTPQSHRRNGAAVAYGDDDSMHSAEARLPLHNCSITSLHMGFNHLGPQAAAALSKTLRYNVVLSTLHLEHADEMQPADFKLWTNSVRLYNSVLQEVVLSHTKLTVKAFESITRILASPDNNISRLHVSRCGLKHQHLEACLEHVLKSRHLTDLDLSGNTIGDKGAEHVAEVLRGRRDFGGVQCPPLRKLDLSDSGLSCAGCCALLLQIGTRPSLQFLDLSHCSLDSSGPSTKGSAVPPSINHTSAGREQDQATAFISALLAARIYELRMNSCALHSKNASLLFDMLADTAQPLSGFLKCLSLSDNQISDSSSSSLCRMLAKNHVLELLDLGFNEFTDASADAFREAVKVSSTAELAHKVCGLAVNMVGNRCDPYILETPGLTRAKGTLLFGVRGNAHDPLNRGFSHVPQRARGNFLVRKQLDEQYRAHFPLQAIHSLM